MNTFMEGEIDLSGAIYLTKEEATGGFDIPIGRYRFLITLSFDFQTG
jgi:hypothetical protein